MKPKQEEKFIFCNLHTGGQIIVHACILSPADAICAANSLRVMAESCNVATKVVPKTALFDSCHDNNVQTVEIDAKTLADFQNMRNTPSEDIRKSIVALMEFYSNHDSLNIILCNDVLETRQSYIKYTAQLANYLSNQQHNYPQVKVQFDVLTTRLGIFCRKGGIGSTLNSSFIGSIVSSLRVYKSAEVDIADIPMSYLGNRAALKHVLTQKLGKVPRITWSKESVKLFI